MLNNMNNIDLAIAVILLLSALTACFRGFFKEVLSIAGWILTAFITARALPYVQPFARDMIVSQTVADFAASVSLFIVFLIIWAIVTGKIIKKLRSSSLSGFDRLLGFVFGILRGSFLISLTYLFASFLISKDDLGFLLKDTISAPYLESAANFLEKMVPEEITNEVKPKLSEDDKDAKTESIYEKLIQPSLEGLKDSGGYKESDRENLDKLIEETSVFVEELESP